MPQVWQPPPDDCYKLNFDAGFNSSTKVAKLGVVIRNHQGDFMAGLTRMVESVPDATTAEALACKEGVRFAQDSLFRDLIIEGDSLNIVKRLQQVKIDRAPSGRIVDDARHFISGFRFSRVVHVRREANAIAHLFAQHAVVGGEPRYWYEEPPDFARHLWSNLMSV